MNKRSFFTVFSLFIFVFIISICSGIKLTASNNNSSGSTESKTVYQDKKIRIDLLLKEDDDASRYLEVNYSEEGNSLVFFLTFRAFGDHIAALHRQLTMELGKDFYWLLRVSDEEKMDLVAMWLEGERLYPENGHVGEGKVDAWIEPSGSSIKIAYADDLLTLGIGRNGPDPSTRVLTAKYNSDGKTLSFYYMIRLSDASDIEFQFLSSDHRLHWSGLKAMGGDMQIETVKYDGRKLY